MKRFSLLLFAVLSCILTSCTTYQAIMSEPTNNPIREKLPRMDIDFYAGDVQGANVDFVKNIVRGEINQNIVASSGQRQGTIEVNCERVYLKQNLALAYVSGLSLLSLNILGMPFSISNVDVTLSFKLLNTQGEVVDNYRYSSHKSSALGFYYGKDASVCLVEATKDIMKRFRDDVYSNNADLIAKLREKLPENEPTKQVKGLGTTALEQMIVRWDIQSRPQGADIFWRVVSKTPDVKSTNNKYLMTTPYEATKAIDIKGLTYQTASNVRIILRCEKDGYMPQEKEFDVRMILDQEEISAFFRLVKE